MSKIFRYMCLALALCSILSLASCSGRNIGSEDEEIVYKTYDEYVEGAILHYGTKDENFRYKVYDICVTINEYVGSGEKVIIPDTLKVVLDSTEVKVLPVIAIEEGVFAEKEYITEVTIGANILKIANNAFNGCTALKTVNMSSSVNELGDAAFANCIRLKSIIIPAKVEKVPPSAFDGCSMLTKVVIEAKGDGTDSEKTLNSKAFANCDRLTTIWIPADITAIDHSVFFGSAAPTVFGTETSKAAVFAAENKLDFVISSRKDFDFTARQYKPTLTLDDEEVGQFSIGDTADCGVFTIHLKDAKYFRQLGDLKAEDGYTYAVLYFDVKNTTAGTHYFEGLNVDCRSYAETDEGYYKFTKKPVMLATSVLDSQYPVGNIGAGKTLSGVMVFKVYKEFIYLTVDFSSYEQTGSNQSQADDIPAKFKVQ